MKLNFKSRMVRLRSPRAASLWCVIVLVTSIWASVLRADDTVHQALAVCQEYLISSTYLSEEAEEYIQELMGSLTDAELSLEDAQLFFDLYQKFPQFRTSCQLISTVGGIGFRACPSGTGTVVMIADPTMDASTDYTFQLPNDAGSSGDVLTTDGTGITSWQAGGFSACEIISSCTYFTIEIPYSPDTYQLIMQPDTSNTPPAFQLAVNGSQPNISLELVIHGTGALYAESDSTNVVLPAYDLEFPNVPGSARGAYAVDLQLTRTSPEYVAAGFASVLVGGFANQIGTFLPSEGLFTGIAAAIVGGLENTANAPFSGIFCGSDHIITFSGAGSVILGGADNYVDATNSAVVSGFDNIVYDPHSVIVGGQNNILGGDKNPGAHDSSVILGGNTNEIAGSNSAHVGGGSNIIGDDYCVVVGGSGNQISSGGTGSVILGGVNNSANGQGSVVGGSTSNAGGQFAFSFGAGAQSSADGTFVFADSTAGAPVVSTANSFNVYATGGVFMPSSILGGIGATVVQVDLSTGQLQYNPSAMRYKDNIKPLDSAYSDKVLQLEPVSFNYKKTPDIDSIGLVAEAVHEILPELVVRNKDGEIETVKYHELPVLLLAALKKQAHAYDEKFQKLERQLAALQEPHSLFMNR